MNDKKIDYKTEGLSFLKLKKSGEKITQAKFCERRRQELGKTLSLAYFRKVLRKLKGGKKNHLKIKEKKISTSNLKKGVREPFSNERETHGVACDWSALKAEFMQGEHKNLSALARAYGIDPGNYQFRKNTKGWKKERLVLSTETNKKTIDNLTKDRATDNARNIYAEILVVQWQLLDILEDVAATKFDWKEITTPSEARDVAGFVLDMQKAIERIMPNLQGLEKMADMRSVFDGLGDGTMDIETAAIAFVRMGVNMPEPLKIILQKHQPEEAPPDDGDEITEEEILARRQEMMGEIETERDEFVAERKKEVAEIKKELSHVDSFGEANERA
jgi:hypothetical protein